MNTVMLVEDEDMIRNGLKNLIEQVIGGYRVIAEARNGKEALELLNAKKPDLLITDIRMGEMNGIEMIRRIRDLDPHLKILIISGYAEFEYAKQAMRYGVSDYLLKPIDRVELAQFLNQFQNSFRQSTYLDDFGEENDRQERSLIRKVKQLIVDRLDQGISLQYIADQVHLNPQYLSALFKLETGQNFSEFVTQCRINKAKRLLQNTNLKIYEIAQLCGYASAKHFMAVFKQYVGATPSEYREGSQLQPNP